MLLGVTLIVLITHIPAKTMESMTKRPKKENNRKVTSVLTQGDSSEAVYGWGKIMQEFEQSALLMTEMVMTMMTMAGKVK